MERYNFVSVRFEFELDYPVPLSLCSLCSLRLNNLHFLGWMGMAEGVGFEPTDACDVSGFQDRCNKPLYHPSIFLIYSYLHCF